MDAAVRRAQQAARPKRLVVAARAGTGSGLLADVLGACGRRRDAVPLEILFTSAQSAALRDGTADVGVLCGDEDLEGLEVADLTREEPVAARDAFVHAATAAMAERAQRKAS